MPTFFPILETLMKRGFWYRQQFLFRFWFYLLNRSKTLSFHRCLQFWEEEKVRASQARWIQWLRHVYTFVVGQKPKSMISFSTILWHAIAIEENSEQNLYICPNLTCFFRSWLYWALSLRWLAFGINVIAIHSWLVTNYDFFEQMWIVVERSMRRSFWSKFSNFGTIFAATRFMPEASVKIACHEPYDMPTSIAASICLFTYPPISKWASSEKLIAGPLSEAYTQPHSFGWGIKLIICQVRHELSVTIHEISTSWKTKTLDGGPYITDITEKNAKTEHT